MVVLYRLRCIWPKVCGERAVAAPLEALRAEVTIIDCDSMEWKVQLTFQVRCSQLHL